MQRLFATFPDGRPGLALLLLRVALGIVFLSEGFSLWPIRGVGLICFILALFLISGAYLPYVSFLGVFAGTTASFALGTAKVVEAVFLLSVLASAGLLGAGAYSVDGWQFGRRRVIIATPAKRKP